MENRRDYQIIVEAVQEAVKETVNGKIDGLKVDFKEHTEKDDKWKKNIFVKVNNLSNWKAKALTTIYVASSLTLPLLGYIWWQQLHDFQTVKNNVITNTLSIKEIKTLLDNATIYEETKL